MSSSNHRLPKSIRFGVSFGLNLKADESYPSLQIMRKSIFLENLLEHTCCVSVSVSLFFFFFFPAINLISQSTIFSCRAFVASVLACSTSPF